MIRQLNFQNQKQLKQDQLVCELQQKLRHLQVNHNIKLKEQQEKQKQLLSEQQRQHKLQISEKENVFLNKTKLIQQQQQQQLVKIDAEIDSLEWYENMAKNINIKSLKSESEKLDKLVRKLPDKLHIITDILDDVKERIKEEADSHTSLEGILGSTWDKGPLNKIKAKVTEYETIINAATKSNALIKNKM